jgi:Mg/Co/Ni transporter MgtE
MRKSTLFAKRMNKWDFITLKSFCTTKEMVSKLKSTHRMGENICQLHIRQRTDNQNIQGT